MLTMRLARENEDGDRVEYNSRGNLLIHDMLLIEVEY
jgi:hypothetical protein